MTMRITIGITVARLLAGVLVAASASGACAEPVAGAEGFMRVLAERDRALAAAEPRRAAMGSEGVAQIRSVTPDASKVAVFGTVEFAVDAGGSWVNPFDPDDVRLDAEVTTPGGAVVRVPGFYFVGYERRRGAGGEEIVTRTGERGWRVRFTPREEGRHRVVMVLDDGSVPLESEVVEIEAVGSAGAGFVRRAKVGHRYLEHDDGSLFFPLGLNHGWPGVEGTYAYDRTIERTAAGRGNTVRVWLAPTFHHLSLETSERIEDHGLMGGLGWMNQDAAWRFDHVVGRAEAAGVKVLPVAFSFSGWRSANGPSNWKESPYNAALGGPMDRASEVFTDPVARTLAKRRLRYMVARWGHSTAVMAWELWNEVTGVDDYDDEKSALWHTEMAAYLKELDPYERLVTTSTWWTEGTARLDGLDDIDIVMTHEYNAPDHAVPHYGAGRWKPEAYGKPHLTGEFGNQEFDSGDSGVYGPETISVHNVLWAGLMAGSAGGGLYWYWEIGDKEGWHGLFRPVAEFVDEPSLNTTAFESVLPEVLGYAGADGAAAGTPGDGVVRLPAGAASWNPGAINTPNTITIGPAGFADTPWLIPNILHPESNRSLHNAVSFRMNFVADGWFTARVNNISGWGGAGLRFEVDGVVVGEHAFADTDAGSTTEISAYNGAYQIPVPAGQHVIRVSNPGRDWARVTFEAGGLLDASSVPLWATGLVRAGGTPTGELAGVVWLRHRDYNWGAERAGVERSPVAPARFRLAGVEPGAYSIEWHDTRDGSAIATVEAEADAEGLVLVSPVVRDSAAAKVRRR